MNLPMWMIFITKNPNTKYKNVNIFRKLKTSLIELLLYNLRLRHKKKNHFKMCSVILHYKKLHKNCYRYLQNKGLNDNIILFTQNPKTLVVQLDIKLTI